MRTNRTEAARYMDEMSFVFGDVFTPEAEAEPTPEQARERAAVASQRAEEDRKYAAFMAANAPARMRKAS